MANEIDIVNVVSVSVALPGKGLADYAVNNIMILTTEQADDLPLGYGVYVSPNDVATDFGAGSKTYAMVNAIFSQTMNPLAAGGSVIVLPSKKVNGDDEEERDETFLEHTLRALETEFFGGMLAIGYDSASDDDVIEVGQTLSSNDRLFWVARASTDALLEGGLFYRIQASNMNKVRMVLYTLGQDLANNLAAAICSRLFSTNFEGTSTTLTMHMKDLVGFEPDTGINQTYLTLANNVGADLLINIGGLTKVWSSGGNDFDDNQFNLIWLIFALRVAGFNVIATNSTKVPQTEDGMTLLKSAYTSVLDQAVRNGFIAPGKWNNPTTFGDLESFHRNLLETGYYIYSTPITQQSQTQRKERKAPLIQIACKYAGAIHQTSVIVNIEE